MLDLYCSDRGEKQIAAELAVSAHRVRHVLEALRRKYNVQSGRGLVLKVIRSEFCFPVRVIHI